MRVPCPGGEADRAAGLSAAQKPLQPPPDVHPGKHRVPRFEHLHPRLQLVEPYVDLADSGGVFRELLTVMPDGITFLSVRLEHFTEPVLRHADAAHARAMRSKRATKPPVNTTVCAALPLPMIVSLSRSMSLVGVGTVKLMADVALRTTM